MAPFRSARGVASILRIYTQLHEHKMFQHWMWSAVERIAAGDDPAEVFKEFGYVRERRGGKNG